MEAMAGSCILDGEWESLYKTFSSSDVDPDLDFAFLLNHNPHFPSDHLPPDEGLFSLLTGHENPIAPSLSDLGAPFSTQGAISSNDLSGSSNGSASSYVDTLNQLTQLINIDDQIPSLSPFEFLLDTGLLAGQVSSEASPLIEMDGANDRNGPLGKRKCSDHSEMDAEEVLVQPKKRPLASKNGEKGKGKMQSKKNQDGLAAEEENNGGSINGQNSSCKISDDESNASQEVTNEESKQILNMNGKKRASRGAATDPQSLYARRRRERINERLKILQTLVPNGTKVDISTMLEEAVHYVKFLQLQIKLLSSDEMWMYAPLAYNGFDVGLHKRLSPWMQY